MEFVAVVIALLLLWRPVIRPLIRLLLLLAFGRNQRKTELSEAAYTGNIETVRVMLNSGVVKGDGSILDPFVREKRDTEAVQKCHSEALAEESHVFNVL